MSSANPNLREPSSDLSDSLMAKFGRYGFAPVLWARDPTNGRRSPKDIMRKSAYFRTDCSRTRRAFYALDTAPS